MGVFRVNYRTEELCGNWWITEAFWHVLEQSGWVVKWNTGPSGNRVFVDGAPATEAYREGLTFEEALEEWEAITQQSPHDRGFKSPHYFTTSW